MVGNAGVDRSRRARQLAAGVSLAVLAGCAANPLVRWVPPRPSASSGESLEFAKSYARAARDAYQQRVFDATGEQAALSNALIGVGVLATGAGLARAHRDAYTTLAVAGGAGYVFGQQNLRPDRTRVYVAATEALDCALAAVIPLDLSNQDVERLHTLLDALGKALSSQAAELSRPRPDTPDARALEAASRELARSSDAAHDSGRAVLGKSRRAGRELVAAVDRLQTETDKAVLETVPDLSAVRAAIAGIAEYASDFAPGSDVGERVKNAFAAQTRAAVPLSRSVPGLAATSADALIQANETLASAARALLDAIASFDVQASPSAAAACKVSGVVAGLSLSTAELSFAAGADQTQSFIVTGGVKPYAVTVMTAASGVTVRSPGFDHRVDVMVTKDAKPSDDLGIAVQDSSSPPKLQRLKLRIGAAGGDDTTKTTPPPSDRAATAKRKADLGESVALLTRVQLPSGHVVQVLERRAGALVLGCESRLGVRPDAQRDVLGALLMTANLAAKHASLPGPPLALLERTGRCMSPSTTARR